MEVLSAISSVVMAGIWIFYLQLFYFQYRRANRAYMVIHHAQNGDPGSVCLFVNMSAEPVHIQMVQAVVRDRSGEEHILKVTEFERVDEHEVTLQRALRQGPVRPGEFLLLGTFREIILGRNSENEESVTWLQDIQSIEIRAAAIHGPSPFPVGVRRVFTVHQNGEARIVPYNIHTEQLTRRRDRSTVRQWLEQELNPENAGESESDQSEQSAEARQA